MALFDALSFVGFAEAQPVGVSGTGGTDAVTLQLSDSTTTTVFSSSNVARRAQTYMAAREMYFMNPNDDITVVQAGPKLVILENTMQNQRLLNGFTIVYAGGRLRCIHRNLSTMYSLQDALSSVGYRHLGSSWQNNYDMQNTSDPFKARIKVFDWYYVDSPTTSTAGTLLADANPMTIDLTP